MNYQFSFFVALGILWLPVAGAAEPNGERVYKLKCANCHGDQGEGSKKFPRRLEGDRSIAQLAKLIHETMPESNPGSISANDADAVAKYIHDAFYSAVARERNRPARVEVSRLTVRQYRQAVADLVGSFRGATPVVKASGLQAEYFKGRRFNRGDRVLERLDPQVDFNFGTKSPVPGKIEPHEFLIRWAGSLQAPDTGAYEFVVRTEHAARLWINDNQRPIIDAWVKSGNDIEYRATLFLIGGRSYPLRLEFSKAKQGVDDSKKLTTKPPSMKASVALLWKRPYRAIEPIPTRHLAANSTPEVYCCATPFPPDDRSYGWERGTTVSKAWDEAVTEAALDAAGYMSARLPELAGVREGATDRGQKLAAFCRTFAERAYRRPLTPEQQGQIDKQLVAAKEPESAAKRVVLLVLLSPRFLYRELNPPIDGYDTATRLSFAMWDSIPDQELLSAAASGKLTSPEQVKQQARRMLADPRARAKLREFLLTWLKADYVPDLIKDEKRFPGFDASLISDLRTSLELFLDDVVWSESSDFRQLVLSSDLFVNDRLARFYGLKSAPGPGFAKVQPDGDKRCGVLTHPYLMASFAHSSESSPIHRGVFLARGVLGISLRPPPEAVAPLAPELHPDMTTRERVSMQTKATACMTCHGIINPLGFTLENFDAVGRYRDKDHDKPVDATGSYRTRDGKVVTVKNARELAQFLAGSEEAHAAFIEQMFHHLVQQPVRAFGSNTLDQLRKTFANSNFNVRSLAIDILAASALQSDRTARVKGESR